MWPAGELCWPVISFCPILLSLPFQCLYLCTVQVLCDLMLVRIRAILPTWLFGALFWGV